MTVMRETGLIVVSAWRGTLYQLLLQEGSFVEKQIKHPCEHRLIYMVCVQEAGHEYLAVSCYLCGNIKLMDLNKPKGNSSESQLIQYEIITAFSGEKIICMCHGENRIFVQTSRGDVLELDTSTTTFTKVRTISTSGSVRGLYTGLYYVPHPHRLLLVAYDDDGGVRAVSCDDKKEAGRVNSGDLCSGELSYTPTHESIIVADWSRNEVVILSPSNGSRLQSIQLPNNVHGILGLCAYNDQLIVRSEGRISYFSLK